MSQGNTLMLVIMSVSCLFFVILGGGLIAVFVWMARRFVKTARQGSEAIQSNAEEYFADNVPTLRPWQAEALADLASLIETSGGQTLGSIHYNGVLKSLASPETTGWLAYDLRLKRGKGSLQLQTSRHTVQLDIASDSIGVTVEGEPLGQLHLVRYRNATLLDAAGKPVGDYRHQKRDVFWRQKGFFAPYYGLIELHNRPIAEINNNLIRSVYVNPSNPLIARLNHPAPPLFRNLASTLTPDEESWLLALVGLQIYYRVMDRVQDNY